MTIYIGTPLQLMFIKVTFGCEVRTCNPEARARSASHSVAIRTISREVPLGRIPDSWIFSTARSAA